MELHFIYALLRPAVETEQELGNMMSHLHMCTPVSSHVNTKLTPLPCLRLIRMDAFVLYAGQPAALALVRPPEWSAKWTRRGCRDCTGRTHMCTPVCRGRQNTAGVCLHAVVLKIFKTSRIFYSIFVFINSLNDSTACLAVWEVSTDFTDLWIALHKDLNTMLRIQMFLRVFLRIDFRALRPLLCSGCSLSGDAPCFHMRSVWTEKCCSLPDFSAALHSYCAIGEIQLLKKSHTDVHINARIQLVKRWF